MRFSGQLNGHRFTQAFSITMAVGLLFLTSQIGLAQSWPVHSPAAREPVPQYSPRYPLNLNGLPERDVPSNQNVPFVRNDPGFRTDPAVQDDRSRPIATPEPFQVHPPRPINMYSPAATSASPLSAPKSDPESVKRSEVNWDIYRDRNKYPIDPRKRCDCCTRPTATQPLTSCNLPGLRGRPYIGIEPGACQCDQKKPFKHPEFSVYWPRPFSAKLDESFPDLAAGRDNACQKKRIVDVFDGLAKFKLSGYQRKDNGYCGRGADPYGCLGESKQTGQIVNANSVVR